MIPLGWKRFGVPVIAGLMLLASGVPSTALNVQPVIVDLLSVGRRASTVITLENTFPTAVPVELVAHPIEIVDGELKEMDVESEDILIFPAQATVAGGASQAFRIQWVGDPAPAQSQHFFVTVAQLPVVLPENQNLIQVLHNFKVLVSVGAPDAEPDLKVVSAEIRVTDSGKAQPVLTVANAGGTYGYVGRSRMTVTQRAPGGEEVFRQTFEPEDVARLMGLGLVPSGQTRRMPVNVDLPQTPGTLSIELVAVEER